MSDPRFNVRDMLTAETLISRPDFSVATWNCTGEHADWSEPESPSAGRFVLVRAGRFRRRSCDGPSDHDATVGYLGEPGDIEQFAHPHGGDACTSLQLSAESWWQLAGEPQRPGLGAVYVDARLELAHRRLLATCRDDPDYQLAEGLLRLVAAALRSAARRPTPVGSPARLSDRRMGDRAREAIRQADPAAGGLFPLAAALEVSPYQLSRSFSRELGVSVTRYRNRVRIATALDLLRGDDCPLAEVAATLGFADQAHLSRSMRQHTGRTPAALRRELRRDARA